MTIETQSSVAEVSKRADVVGEPGMEAYAASRLSGSNHVETKELAAVTKESETVEATDETAASAEEAEASDTKTEVSATTEDVDKDVEEGEVVVESKNVKRRVDKLTAKVKEAESKAKANEEALSLAKQEAAALKAEAERLKAEAAELANAAIPVVKPKIEDPIPSRADFDDPDEFAIALSQHAAREQIRQSSEAARLAAEHRANEVRRANDEANKAKAAAQVMEMHKTFQERVEKAKEELPDYEEKVLKNDKIMLDTPVFFSIEQSELGAQILYYLANNPSEAENLNKLQRTNPLSAAIRLGEIQSEVRQLSKPKVSKAAAPVNPVRNRSNPERQSLEEMSMEDYNRAYKSRVQAKYASEHPERVRRSN